VTKEILRSQIATLEFPSRFLLRSQFVTLESEVLIKALKRWATKQNQRSQFVTFDLGS